MPSRAPCLFSAILLGLFGWANAPRAAEPSGPLTFGQIERLDPRFDALVPPGATLEKLAEGFDWSEGPTWDARAQRLLFSDVPKNTVYQWQQGKGVSEFLKPSGYTGPTPRGGEPGSNGLLMEGTNPFGGLLLCQHGDRRVARLSGTQRDLHFETLADRYQGKRLNSPNDLTLATNGDIFFTDPPYGLLKNNDDPAKELPFNGVYRLSRAGVLTLLTKDLPFPNGIGLAPDEKTLYVAVSDGQRPLWMAYDLAADGTLARGRVLRDATPLAKFRKGAPDGFKVDRAGNLFASGPGGIVVMAPDGTLLGTIGTGEATANCAFGDDGSSLYITADMFLCRIKTATVGLRFPGKE